MSTHSTGCNFGSVQIKPMEFVDDTTDPSRDKASAIESNVVWRPFSMKSSQQKNVSY